MIIEKSANYLMLLIKEGSINVNDFYLITFDNEGIKLQGRYDSTKVLKYRELWAECEGEFTVNDAGYTILVTRLDGVKIRIVLT